MEHITTLKDLSPGQGGRVAGLNLTGGMRRRMLDLGLTAGAEVICLGRSPVGDPAAYLIRGAVIAIRDRDAALVSLEKGGTPWA